MRLSKIERRIKRLERIERKRRARESRKAQKLDMHKIMTHHRFPQRLGGESFIEGMSNTIEVEHHMHEAFHHFFEGCDTPEQFAQRLSEWIDPRYVVIASRRA